MCNVQAVPIARYASAQTVNISSIFLHFLSMVSPHVENVIIVHLNSTWSWSLSRLGAILITLANTAGEWIKLCEMRWVCRGPTGWKCRTAQCHRWRVASWDTWFIMGETSSRVATWLTLMAGNYNFLFRVWNGCLLSWCSIRLEGFLFERRVALLLGDTLLWFLGFRVTWWWAAWLRLLLYTLVPLHLTLILLHSNICILCKREVKDEIYVHHLFWEITGYILSEQHCMLFSELTW